MDSLIREPLHRTTMVEISRLESDNPAWGHHRNLSTEIVLIYPHVTYDNLISTGIVLFIWASGGHAEADDGIPNSNKDE